MAELDQREGGESWRVVNSAGLGMEKELKVQTTGNEL